MRMRSQFESFLLQELQPIQPPKIVGYSSDGSKISFSLEGSPQSVDKAVHAFMKGAPYLNDERGRWMPTRQEIKAMADGSGASILFHLHPA
jgi:hypothetical protein